MRRSRRFAANGRRFRITSPQFAPPPIDHCQIGDGCYHLTAVGSAAGDLHASYRHPDRVLCSCRPRSTGVLCAPCACTRPEQHAVVAIGRLLRARRASVGGRGVGPQQPQCARDCDRHGDQHHDECPESPCVCVAPNSDSGGGNDLCCDAALPAFVADTSFLAKPSVANDFPRTELLLASRSHFLNQTLLL